MIDAHIHLDQYAEKEQWHILHSDVEAFIAVSMDLASAKRNLQLATYYPCVKPAFGYHPEQAVLQDETSLFQFIYENASKMVAIGEVGLPYYSQIDRESHKRLLGKFMLLAKELGKPIILHAVYEDAIEVCDMLEEYEIRRAHFHWFKGDRKTTERMKNMGYYISVTPDVCYEKEIQRLVEHYPLSQMMIETDGPWRFDGPFQQQVTTPHMMNESIATIAQIKQLSIQKTAAILLANTKHFYRL